MKQIKAYQCPLCESIHAIQSDAKACEKECKAYAKADAIEKERKANIQYWRNYVRLNATSIQDIIDMSIKASREICPASELKTVRFNVSYTDKASNSHANPLDGVSNWCGRDKDQPTSYPGLTGSIFFEYENYNKKKVDIFGSYNAGILGICTGSGGYNTGGANYTVTIWLDDFPLIKAKIEKELEEKKIYAETVKESNSLLNAAYTSDSKYKENVKNIEDIQAKIVELQAASSLLRNVNREIYEEYQRPYKFALEAAYGALSKEFIHVNPNG